MQKEGSGPTWKTELPSVKKQMANAYLRRAFVSLRYPLWNGTHFMENARWVSVAWGRYQVCDFKNLTWSTIRNRKGQSLHLWKRFVLTASQLFQLSIGKHLNMPKSNEWIWNITGVHKRWKLCRGTKFLIEPVVMRDPEDIPRVHNSPRKKANPLHGKQTVDHLGGNLDPESLLIVIMQIDHLRKEEDDSGSPEDNGDAINSWTWSQSD